MPKLMFTFHPSLIIMCLSTSLSGDNLPVVALYEPQSSLLHLVFIIDNITINSWIDCSVALSASGQHPVQFCTIRERWSE